MPKYIDADVLLEQMKLRRFFVGRSSDPICIIEDAPAADVSEVRHGRWIETDDRPNVESDRMYRCSVCNFADEHSPSADVPFCWHCGAKMSGPEGDEMERARKFVEGKEGK